MSAIREWFGYYNAVFTYIERQYGEEELDRYFDYLVKDANMAAVRSFEEGGLPAICDHYAGNFRKDGDENSVQVCLTQTDLRLDVKCPGFYYAVPVEHEDRRPGPALCKGCRLLNGKMLAAAGYHLEICEDGQGNCSWKIQHLKDEV